MTLTRHNADDTITHHRFFPAAIYTFVVVMVGTTLPTPMYALYGQKLHFSVLTTTVVFATYAGGVIVALIGFGGWSDILGRRPMLAAAITLGALSSVTFLTAGPMWQLLIGRALSGLSAGIVTGTATVAIVESAPPRWRSRAAIIATMANICGLGLGPLFAGILVEYAPWQLHLVFACHLALLAVAAGGLAIGGRSTSTRARGRRLGAQSLSVPAPARAAFVPAAIAAFAGFAVMGLFTAVAPSFLSGVLNLRNHAVAGLVVFLLFAASALAQICTGRMRTPLALTGGCAVLVVGMVFIIVALLQSSATFLIIGAIVAGAGQGVSFSKSVRSVAEASPADRRAEVTSTLFIVAYLAISIPVVGEGLAAQHWGLRTAGVAFAAIVAVLAALAIPATWLAETKTRPTAPRN